MSLESVPGSELKYHLIAFDKEGRERTDDPDGGVYSRRVLADLAGAPPTDIFLLSHGWMGDIPAARDQYRRWIVAMLTCPDDLARMRQLHPAFLPMIIGLHWPSLPFGDEEFGAGAASFDPGAMPDLDALIQSYADRIADTPRARAALRTIFAAAIVDSTPATLPPEVVEAYRVLNEEGGMGAGGAGAAPGADRDAFDPETAYQNALASADAAPVSFGGFSLSGLLAPLQQLSFWRMKERARAFGESGGHALLKQIQTAAPTARLHLMGHSFGCIVVSAATAGPEGQGSLSRPIDTLFLVQGALSLWSYCSRIDAANGTPGYFRSILSDAKVAGAVLATTSDLDTAVGRYYPLGAGVAQQVTFAPGQLPKYGGLGTFGIQGPDTEAQLFDALPINQSYGFKAGSVYNLDASGVVRNGEGASGAHSDIAHPELAHAYWEAILARG
jgi:hypothetical protein